MNFYSPESQNPQPSSSRRRSNGVDHLILRELNPHVVIDHAEAEQTALTLMTFGSVRECCPKCQQGSLKLVLRQASVRMAHLFCAECESCFDASYADGEPALTI
ncbi:hypothetical protein LK540_16875 [Massilia sp. IC2-278]|uniref:hypothetical protein n=1 Tax=Massilia sp. IC2-278 TaxID=2887200 RepID=UPI001E35C58A|nr:hypothetical protein [Massilia sp. IC2-278]MCC2962105.1 hypothetical protein [Massilia sp. IC2-278]